ncbi:MAG: DUF3499 domain-containing protein [Actinomycetaceae bacterium]|nr:DUF3499 domain-containing protein [Actinomycetaceae bacterium]
MRKCSRLQCGQPAVAVMTYSYTQATVVIGPLPTRKEPQAYELCAEHANRLTAPRGWQIIRLATDFEPAPPSDDDIMALAEAVRNVAHSRAGSDSSDARAHDQNTERIYSYGSNHPAVKASRKRRAQEGLPKEKKVPWGPYSPDPRPSRTSGEERTQMGQSSSPKDPVRGLRVVNGGVPGDEDRPL